MPAAEPGILPGRWLVVGLVLSILVVGLLLAGARLTIDATDLLDRLIALGAVAAGVACLALREPRTRGQRIARDGIEYFGLLTAICLLGAIASYPVAANSHGFSDATMERVDRALRFNWVGWYDVVVAHPVLQRLETIAYHSIFATPALILGYFAFTGRRGAARMFLAAFWVAAVLTLLLFPVAPAEGPLAFLWHRDIPYMPASALYQSELIPQLRAHTMHMISVRGLHGLVCAPSFHTASAVLFVAAAWPFRGLRWIVVPINIAMLLSIPVEGTHYLIDMILGALVALVSVGIMQWAVRLLPDHETGPGGFEGGLRRLRTRDLEAAYMTERRAGPRANAITAEIERRHLID